ncbi:hypothetical protein GDO78_020623 [Eleutherodactylus coqui]|uniref:Uncharacterized protein n=1 Tax=Eleutherodactylus coqui TaxID=57060 RepID=A0A8J6C5R7_ELECQ|nr:hypothetical protein GDO78_020623 [Eleutherodactylus coqui]
MELYKDFTSKLANIVSGDKETSSSLFRTSVVSLVYDGNASTNDLRIWSRYLLTPCVRLSTPDTMGLPLSGSRPLCIFGNP